MPTANEKRKKNRASQSAGRGKQGATPKPTRRDPEQSNRGQGGQNQGDHDRTELMREKQSGGGRNRGGPAGGR